MSAPALKAAAIWLVLAALAIGNGVLREQVLARLFEPTLALPLSGISLSLLILLITWFVLPWFGALRASQYAVIGGQWLLLTLAFEFGFGRYVAGKSWAQLLAAYDLSTGNLWLLVLAVTACAPYAVAELKRGSSVSGEGK